MIVLDTDYDDYLMLYRCREEQRVPENPDDYTGLMSDQELFRQMVEEYDHDRHPEKNAQQSMEFHQHNDRWQAFQHRLREDDLHKMTDDTLQSEIDEFLMIDPNHSQHFIGNRPDVEMWKKIRHFYA